MRLQEYLEKVLLAKEGEEIEFRDSQEVLRELLLILESLGERPKLEDGVLYLRKGVHVRSSSPRE